MNKPAICKKCNHSPMYCTCFVPLMAVSEISRLIVLINKKHRKDVKAYKALTHDKYMNARQMGYSDAIRDIRAKLQLRRRARKG